MKEELDVIFSLLNEKKHLVVLDCKSVNYPSQISESALTPIVVYIKIIPKVSARGCLLIWFLYDLNVS